MKEYRARQKLLYAFLALLFAVLACQVGNYTIVQQTQPSETIPPPAASQAVTSQAATIEIPTVESTSESVTPTGVWDSLLPVSGSTLRWVDFSDFVYIPQGDFIMGEDRPEGGDTIPMHTVSLSGFWIQQSEVTNRQYAQCVQAGICTPPNVDADTSDRYGNPYFVDYPVVGVDWFQASAYCGWIKGRLPTEAEWEKAGRGTQGSLFPWGDENPDCTLLNFDQCLRPAEPNYDRSYMTGISTYDAFDMSGNVFEWTNDWYVEDAYTSDSKVDPTGPEQGKLKVYRGGSYLTPQEEIKLTQRFSLEPEKYNPELGFRCVLGGDVVPPPPLCQVVPIGASSSGQDGVIIKSQFSEVNLVGYCTGNSDKPLTSINVSFGSAVDAGDYSVTASGSPLNCKPYASNASRLGCFGAGLKHGGSVEIQICHNAPPPYAEPAGEPTCPTGYTYSPDSTSCEIGNSNPPGAPCPTGYVDTPGVGCLPVPAAGSCPGGYYQLTLGSTAVCVPLDPCLYSDKPGSCNQLQSCPPPYTYLPDKGCCAAPAQPQPVCPIGYDYDKKSGACIKRAQIDKRCETFTVKIPACPTPVPQNAGCSKYTSPNTCPRSCQWIPNPTGAPGGRCAPR